MENSFKEPQGLQRVNRQELVLIDQTKRIIDSFDINQINSIINELLKKSNSDLVVVEGAIKTDVIFDASRSASGWHNDREIKINAAKFTFDQDYKKDYRRILSTYIHEYVHACAVNQKKKKTTGFKYMIEDKEINVPINEGFTELIADYVYEEYLKRSGDLNRFGHTSHQRTVKGYIEERVEALQMISDFAKKEGVPESVVFGAYVRAYFSHDASSFEDTISKV
ncbi:MAG: hypothetical protein RI935_461 [Candidatus Parcubacteria bacterium]